MSHDPSQINDNMLKTVVLLNTFLKNVFSGLSKWTKMISS